MWPYFGSKQSLVKYYPAPEYSDIIEPFAGSAKYSLKYWDREIRLADKYDVVIKIWHYLQNQWDTKLLSLPEMKFGDHVDDFEWPHEAAKLLMGFIIGSNVARPRKTATSWRTVDRPDTQKNQLRKIADNMYKCIGWDIRLQDYRDVPNQEATWFIDPPYEVQGKEYKHGSKDIDYRELAEWCKSRSGQVIVCEQLGATWLPFQELAVAKGITRKSIEVIWTNRPIVLQERMKI